MYPTLKEDKNENKKVSLESLETAEKYSELYTWGTKRTQKPKLDELILQPKYIFKNTEEDDDIEASVFSFFNADYHEDKSYTLVEYTRRTKPFEVDVPNVSIKNAVLGIGLLILIEYQNEGSSIKSDISELRAIAEKENQSISIAIQPFGASSIGSYKSAYDEAVQSTKYLEEAPPDARPLLDVLEKYELELSNLKSMDQFSVIAVEVDT